MADYGKPASQIRSYPANKPVIEFGKMVQNQGAFGPRSVFNFNWMNPSLDRNQHKSYLLDQELDIKDENSNLYARQEMGPHMSKI